MERAHSVMVSNHGCGVLGWECWDGTGVRIINNVCRPQTARRRGCLRRPRDRDRHCQRLVSDLSLPTKLKNAAHPANTHLERV